ncbi:hypothetical protein QC762_101831 [Podospora pseudocomata]|uniref:Uncharacterized protein n=4 Tax=Podospora TaxID=5144 RepID=A0ABR0HWN4_9PEZI|nr:hypothetical protein QC761_101831 [Podospora bellae-mahoneyi]KAK4658439.1 hypothetical protein QC762_101831 [Podospora pseudocomata]KAK4672292.1 hypothetical protein QC763_101831 [Podospora pseudopauciseta]KAK4680783.1 hypothetical protein QC764_101831 [Podospora pseudoanserina]
MPHRSRLLTSLQNTKLASIRFESTERPLQHSHSSRYIK